MANNRPPGIVIAAFYFALSGVLGASSALYGLVATPGFSGFALLFAATFALAVADAVCCYGLWTRQSWTRPIAIGVILASILYGSVHNMVMPDAQWLIFTIMSLVSVAILLILETTDARAHFGLPGKPAALGIGIAIPDEFDFRARLMERNAE